MIRLVLVQQPVEPACGFELGSRPADVTLRKPVPPGVTALSKRAAVMRADVAPELPVRDQFVLLVVGQVVEPDAVLAG